MRQLTVAYGGMSEDYLAPGDRRRFAGFASRSQMLMIPTSAEGAAAVVLTLGADISRWREYKKKHGVLILDIVDAYLDETAFSPKRIFRGVYKSLNGTFAKVNLDYQKLLRELISHADLVICASEEQRLTLLELNSNVHAIVDCFDELYNSVQRAPSVTMDSPILWEGYPENLKHFKILRSSKSESLSIHKFSIVTLPTHRNSIGLGQSQTSSYFDRIGLRAKIIPWTLHNLQTTAGDCKFAIIPIDRRDPMAWKKSENKLLGFWAMGIPVLVSPTPSYTRAALSAGCESILVEEGQWESTLEKLTSDDEFLRRSIMDGHKYALDNALSRAVDSRWMSALQSVDL